MTVECTTVSVSCRRYGPQVAHEFSVERLVALSDGTGGRITRLHDDCLATVRKKTIERPLVRSNRTREWTAVQFFGEWKAKLQLFLPCGMRLLCLTFTNRREWRVSYEAD